VANAERFIEKLGGPHVGTAKRLQAAMKRVSIARMRVQFNSMADPAQQRPK
jgi:hypothetical protein